MIALDDFMRHHSCSYGYPADNVRKMSVQGFLAAASYASHAGLRRRPSSYDLFNLETRDTT
jgi:hypothetical protein